MGGNAFKGLTRMTYQGYRLALNTISEYFKSVKCTEFSSLKSLKKESYGDIDIYVSDKYPKDILEKETDLFKIKDKKYNGNTIHYLIEIKITLDSALSFQLDVNFTDNVSFNNSLNSYNGMNVFLGKVAKNLGLKLTNNGLYIEMPYKNMNGKYEEQLKIKITSDFANTLRFLGYISYDFNYIQTFEDAMKFIVSSEYFDVEYFKEHKDEFDSVFGKYFKENIDSVKVVKVKQNQDYNLNTWLSYNYIKRAYKKRRTDEFHKSRFQFNRFLKTVKYITKNENVLTNKEIGEIIKITKDRYFLNVNKYESRKDISDLIVSVISEYISNKEKVS